LNKILSTDKPSVGFYFTRLLDIILPELTALNQVEGRSHTKIIFITEVVDNICPNTDDVWLRWSALLHDIGKAPTNVSIKTRMDFSGHEFLGGKMAKSSKDCICR
jgi:tRNA nucleotidyltransferase (CCA-adding enzyme)